MTNVSQWGSLRGIRIRLELPSACLYQNEPVTGVVRVESMTTQVTRLREISVMFGSEGTSIPVGDESESSGDHLPAMASRDFAFSFPLSDSTMLGTGQMRVSMSVGSIWYATASLWVMVVPERRVAAYAELAAEIAHHDLAEWRIDGDGIVAELRPKLEVEHLVHGIRVAVRDGQGEIRGTMTVTGRAPGLLRVFPGAQRVHPFRFPYWELEAARNDFEAILFPYLSDLKGLPLPANSNLSVVELPLPSDSDLT